MASVYKRSWRGQDGRERVRWVAAYKDQDGRRHNKGLRSRKDAKAFLVMVASPDLPAGPEVAFGPSRTMPDDAPPLDRVVALAGRDPSWAPR